MAQKKMAPSPFVKWDFTCKTAAEEKATERRAKKYLKTYLLGFTRGLRAVPRIYPKVQFVVTNESFRPGTGKNKFVYRADVVKTFADNATFPQPDSTKDPIKPPPPGN